MSRKTMLVFGMRFLVPLVGLSLLFLGTAIQPSQDSDSKQKQQEDSAPSRPDEKPLETSPVEQGKYLVHHVAMCVKCHSPKDRTGAVIEQQLLEGSPMPVSSPYPNQEWAAKAPALAGLPGGWTEKSLVEFLQTGKTPTGFPIRPPMPPFRMKEADAKAVAAYLQSLDSN